MNLESFNTRPYISLFYSKTHASVFHKYDFAVLYLPDMRNMSYSVFGDYVNIEHFENCMLLRIKHRNNYVRILC